MYTLYIAEGNKDILLHKCFVELRKRNYLVDFETITYGYREELNINDMKYVKNSGSVISIAFILKKFFEIPNIFTKTIDYLTKLQSEKSISNIMQTEFWKLKTSGSNEITLPLFLYEDDFKCGNLLGSHTTLYKMFEMYFSLPCLPPEIRSKLETIFLVQIAHSSDVQEYKPELIYGNVIKQLNSLATEGIQINIKEKLITILFKLALIVGDNLGLNSILGFTTSFDSDSFCRFCKVTKKISMTQCKQNNLLLRDKENYNFNIIENNVQKTGIKVKCVWDDVLDFHVTENFCVDIMHDLLEGVCKYEMGYILHELIFIKKLFTLEALNFKIKYFKNPDNDNKSPLITVLQLQNKYIKMSAAEMKCFILNVSLIFGDLIPRRNVF